MSLIYIDSDNPYKTLECVSLNLGEGNPQEALIYLMATTISQALRLGMPPTAIHNMVDIAITKITELHAEHVVKH